MPTTSPIMPVVRCTRVVPRASCVTLMSRPAMNRFGTFREYRQRYGTQYGRLKFSYSLAT